MRPRGGDRQDALLRLALALCAGSGWLASSIVLLDHLDPPAPTASSPLGTWLRAAACLAALVFSPLCEDALASWVRGVPRIGRALARGVWVLEVLPIFLLPVPIADALIFGSMILAQGHLLLASDDDRNAARCLAAAPLVCVIALAYAPSIPILLLLPGSVLAALLALVVLHGRMARHRLRRNRGQAEGARALRGRLLYVIPLGAMGLGLSLLASLAIDRTLAATRDAHAPVADGGPTDAATPLSGSGDPGAGAGSAVGYAPDLPFSGGTLPFSDDPVMEVRPLGAGGEQVIHLRDFVLDEFHAGGIRQLMRRFPTEYGDGDDGTLDGWTWVRDPDEGARFRRYRVRLRSLAVPDTGWTLVFSPHPLAAITLERIRYDPDQILATPMARPEWFEYEVAVVDRDHSPPALGRLRAVHPDPRYLQLPPASPALTTVAEMAGAWVAGADGDYDRVRSVVDRLLREYTYDLTHLDFEGTEALARFLVERRGYCTHFASTAALMLRTRGVPTRVATGFMAHEWSEERGAFLVRERDAHAWLEVYFEGLGWVTFDPTPPDGRRGEPRPGGEGGEGLADWWTGLRGELDRWMDGASSLGAVLGTLLQGPLVLLRRHPSLWWVVSAAGLLVLHWILERRRLPAGGDGGPPPLAPPTLRLFQRLARSLARHGYRRPPGQTPLEFARVVEREEGGAFGAVTRATRMYYRARFGGRELSSDEERFVEQLVLTLDDLPTGGGATV